MPPCPRLERHSVGPSEAVVFISALHVGTSVFVSRYSSPRNWDAGKKISISQLSLLSSVTRPLPPPLMMICRNRHQIFTRSREVSLCDVAKRFHGSWDLSSIAKKSVIIISLVSTLPVRGVERFAGKASQDNHHSVETPHRHLSCAFHPTDVVGVPQMISHFAYSHEQQQLSSCPLSAHPRDPSIVVHLNAALGATASARCTSKKKKQHVLQAYRRRRQKKRQKYITQRPIV